MSTQSTPQFAEVNGIRIAYEVTGSGLPMLMLHGHPRTHRSWEKVTPLLSSRFTLVKPDRRGYGDSDRGSPPEAYENANMAADAMGLMDHLGFDRFMVVGHDKGAPTARRIAQDHHDRVPGAVILDGMPEGVDVPRQRDTSGRTWYFDFFRQRGVAEQIMERDPGLFFGLFLDRNPHLTAEERAFYVAHFSKPGSVNAVLADYRAGTEVDSVYWSEQVASGRNIETPLCLLWGGRGPTANAPVLEAWGQIAVDVRGQAIEDSAHYIQEEQPAALASHILRFANELGL
jgi:haloacetate dehalogenase